MRFIPNGPSIPDLLLERRDQGRVVFLCGAGVSVNAGMPNFLELTEYVIKYFDPEPGSKLVKSFQPWLEKADGPKEPLDQIFHLLYQEYGREEVNALVTERLRLDLSSPTIHREHQIISEISSDFEGNPQIVTTNFDLLFEAANNGKEYKINQPPELPDIALGSSVSGITYLHGRFLDGDTSQHPYILSSADFGRAYLSEGWATRFIRSLLEHYTVVLVGYQAEDSLVRYLLQGLNYDDMSDRTNLYAFDKGVIEDIETKWRDRGVTAIPYEDHEHLWNTLEEWAKRSHDPRKWKSEILEMAIKGPRSLEPYQRGQVAHLIRDTSGAKLFATHKVPPTPEWLCVFDATCRAAPPSKGTYEFEEEPRTIDPLKQYGLDDDPPRQQALSDDVPAVEQNPFEQYDHLLEWRPGDINPTSGHRLDRKQNPLFIDLPARLNQLHRWIIRVIDSPVTAWWAVRTGGLHPKLANGISEELSRTEGLHPNAYRFWSLILEFQSDSRNYSWDGEVFDVSRRVKHEGWTRDVLRYFKIVFAPRLSAEYRNSPRTSLPPSKSWDQLNLHDFAFWEVHLPHRKSADFDVTDDALFSVFRILEQNLLDAIHLYPDIGLTNPHSPTCYPNRDTTGTLHERDRDDMFVWALELFDRLSSINPGLTRAYVESWPSDDSYYFLKLKLYGLNRIELYEANDSAKTLLNLSQEAFWDFESRRELLFLLQDRWSDFSDSNKRLIIDRLLSGPEVSDEYTDKEELKVRTACRYVTWLELQGIELFPEQRIHLQDLCDQLDSWNKSWAADFTNNNHGSIGWVKTDDTPDELSDTPVNEVIQKTIELEKHDFESHTDRRPFQGLVKSKPRRALASLTSIAKQGKYPDAYWATLIDGLNTDIGSRLHLVFLRRLCQLPADTVRSIKVRYSITRWLELNFHSLYQLDKKFSWEVFDSITSKLLTDDGDSTRSGISQINRVNQRGKPQSRRTLAFAINSPIGHSVTGLIQALGKLNLPKDNGIPTDFKARFELLMKAPGEGSDHAILLLIQQINWLHYLDNKWVADTLLPLFKFDNPFSEPAWNGFLSAAKVPPKEIGTKLKPLILEIFPIINKWNWEDSVASILVQIIIELSIFRSIETDGFNNREARHCLRKMGDRNRQQAIQRLSIIGQREDNGWTKYVIPFINNAWPQERRLCTTSLVQSWLDLLSRTGLQFPQSLEAILKYLVPLTEYRYGLDFLSRELEDQPLTDKFPNESLALLEAVISNSPRDIPYNLEQILSQIIEADPSLARDHRFLRLISLTEHI